MRPPFVDEIGALVRLEMRCSLVWHCIEHNWDQRQVYGAMLRQGAHPVDWMPRLGLADLVSMDVRKGSLGSYGALGQMLAPNVGPAVTREH